MADTGVRRIGGKTYVPLKAVADALGAEVEWDPVKFEFNLVRKA